MRVYVGCPLHKSGRTFICNYTFHSTWGNGLCLVLASPSDVMLENCWPYWGMTAGCLFIMCWFIRGNENKSQRTWLYKDCSSSWVQHHHFSSNWTELLLNCLSVLTIVWNWALNQRLLCIHSYVIMILGLHQIPAPVLYTQIWYQPVKVPEWFQDIHNLLINTYFNISVHEESRLIFVKIIIY